MPASLGGMVSVMFVDTAVLRRSALGTLSAWWRPATLLNNARLQARGVDAVRVTEELERVCRAERRARL